MIFAPQNIGVMSVTPGQLPQQRPKLTLEQKTAICRDCEFNLVWICEHPGCRPCKQRRIGGLKIALDKPWFRCAAGKW